jgi:phosphate transport system substrate-binding protein
MWRNRRGPKRALALRGSGLAIVLSLAFAGCGPVGATPTPPPDPYAGNYTGSGGGGALPHIRALTKRFTELHPGMTWQLEDVGSDTSVVLVEGGDVDFGFVSRDLKDLERPKVESYPLGASGTALAVNAANPVAGLTKEQVRKIFSGEITDWKDVGGTPGRIRLFVREPISSTRTVFESYFFGTKPTYPRDTVEVNDLEETIQAIRSFPTAIGMVTMSDRTYQDTQIRLLAIDNVPANAQNLRDGTYKVRRPLHLLYNPDPTRLKPGIRAFIEFVKGPEGQRILAAL